MDPHLDALDKLHEALTDRIASRYKKKPGEEDKKPAVEISVTKEEPAGDVGGHDEPDGDEVPPEAPAHSPGASAALEALRFIRKHGRK